METGEERRTGLPTGEAHCRVRASGVDCCLRDSLLQNKSRQVQPGKTVGKYRAMAIDSATDKIREIIGEEDDELLGALTQVGGVFQPIVAVAATVKAVVDGADRHHRVCSSIRALCNELDAIREQLPQDATDVLKRPWFRRAMQVMMEEAAGSEDESKARQLGVAVAHGCFPAGDNGHRQEDLASYIHDLAR